MKKNKIYNNLHSLNNLENFILKKNTKCIVKHNSFLIFFLEYKLINKKGEGTFSEVLKAKSLKTDKFVAIKCMKNHFTSID